MFELITAIVERGSGIHDRSKVFVMSIEPVKDVVLLITKKSDTTKVIELIV